MSFTHFLGRGAKISEKLCYGKAYVIRTFLKLGPSISVLSARVLQSYARGVPKLLLILHYGCKCVVGGVT